MARLDKCEEVDFAQYLRQCTDNQVRGVYEKEKDLGHEQEIYLAKIEAARRGIDLD